MKNKQLIILAIIVLLILIAVPFLNNNFNYTGSTISGLSVKELGQDKMDIFANCLTEKGVKMYGAYWCSHCNEEKELFGSSFQFVQYVECDKNGENAKPDECKSNEIIGYPTWIINGIKYEGFKTLAQLSEYTDCKLK